MRLVSLGSECRIPAAIRSDAPTSEQLASEETRSEGVTCRTLLDELNEVLAAAGQPPSESLYTAGKEHPVRQLMDGIAQLSLVDTKVFDPGNGASQIDFYTTNIGLETPPEDIHAVRVSAVEDRPLSNVIAARLREKIAKLDVTALA